jgi:predicted transcriptional regulator
MPVVEDIIDTLPLSQANTRRLTKLANEAGRTPKVVLKHVLRDGFDATEHAIKVVKSRMNSAERISHEDAMKQLDKLIDRNVRNEKQAA